MSAPHPRAVDDDGVTCPQWQCKAPNSPHDLYCGICGAALAALRWQADGGEWQSGDGRLTLRQESEFLRLHFENQGVVVAALILEEEAARALPSWLDSRAVRGRPVVLKPTAEHAEHTSIDLRIDTPRLRALQEQNRLHSGSGRELTAEIVFLTNLSERSLHLTLLLSHKPWVSPAASYFRYLPLDRLAGEGVAHPLEVHFEAATRIQLTDIDFVEDLRPAPEGYARVSGKSFIHLGVRKRDNLPPGASWRHGDLRLRAPQPLLPEGQLGWFSTSIRYQLLCDNEPRPLTCHLSGVIGPGPCLRIVGPSRRAFIPTAAYAEDTFLVENPGGLPVAVQGIEVWRERDGDGERAPSPDCLEVSGLTAGELIAPGERRSVRLAFHPSARPPEEGDAEIIARRVVILHDGWQPLAARHASLDVELQLGRAELGRIGIDFGTSASVVCLMGGETGYPLSLEAGVRPQQLPSLMYFQEHEPTKERPGDFLFGSDALSAAANEPTNLLRSIKTEVVRGTTRKHGFWRGVGAERQRIFKSAQELLDLFIDELRRRAASGTATLPLAVRRAEKWVGRSFVLRHAFFSHPVQVNDAMKAALFAAARAAGLNQEHEDPEEFFGACCVDEATAAVLSYVDHRKSGRLGKVSELLPLERVLCFDMGGGTTDVAAAEVKGVDAFVREEALVIHVNLAALTGDNHLGGNLLAQLLADEILAAIHQQSAATGSAIEIDEIKEALAAPSFTSFQTLLEQRRQAFGARPTPDHPLTEADNLYRLAQQVLAAAEAMKIRFGKEDSVVCNVSGSGWPRAQINAATESEEFEVRLERSAMEQIARNEIGSRLHLLDTVVNGAGWQWSQVTTLLFTGQSMRSPLFRQIVQEYVESKVGAKPEKKLLLVHPGGADGAGVIKGFDPKLCVAHGAAIWGISREQGAWIQVTRSAHHQLTFDVQRNIGGRYRSIETLRRGAALPTQPVPIDLGAPQTTLVLYREGQPFVRFLKFRRTQKVEVEIRSLSDIRLTANGQEVKGEVLL